MAGVDGETEVVTQPRRHVAEHIRCHVEHPPTDVALDVGVAVLVGVRRHVRARVAALGEVVDGGRPAEVDVREHAGLDERGERPVDGGPVHGRLDLRDARPDLLGREVLVGEVGGIDDAQDGIPRRGDALARRPQPGHGAGHAGTGARTLG